MDHGGYTWTIGGWLASTTQGGIYAPGCNCLQNLSAHSNLNGVGESGPQTFEKNQKHTQLLINNSVFLL